MIAQALVFAIVAAEIALPLALVFWAGRRFERYSQERAISAGARDWLEAHGRANGVVGVALHDAAAGEPVELELQADGLTSRPRLVEGHGFPLSRRRRR